MKVVVVRVSVELGVGVIETVKNRYPEGLPKPVLTVEHDPEANTTGLLVRVGDHEVHTVEEPKRVTHHFHSNDEGHHNLAAAPWPVDVTSQLTAWAVELTETIGVRMPSLSHVVEDTLAEVLKNPRARFTRKDLPFERDIVYIEFEVPGSTDREPWSGNGTAWHEHVSADGGVELWWVPEGASSYTVLGTIAAAPGSGRSPVDVPDGIDWDDVGVRERQATAWFLQEHTACNTTVAIRNGLWADLLTQVGGVTERPASPSRS